MPYTLLLADDSATIQRVIELSFANEDISVVAFSNGEHAIKSLEKMQPDIVLADIGMPGRNGYEVARHIKASPSLAHIPVLLLTGAFEPVDPARATAAGCDGVLIKPFEPQEVVGRVKELLARPKPSDRDAEVEHYFEELDQAFANLSATAPPAPPQGSPEPPPSGRAAMRPAEGRPALVDAFAALLAAERAVAAGTEAVASGASRLAHDGSGPADSPVTQSAERSGGAASASQAISTDELVERVASRVLEQLSDRVSRDSVAEIVKATAERLVREEIERIKSTIK